MRKHRETEGQPQGNEAAPDELGKDPRQVGPESAGQSGDAQRLSTTEMQTTRASINWRTPTKLLKRPG